MIRWKVGKLADIAEIVTGFAFKSADMSANKGLPLIKIKNINNRSVSKSCDSFLKSESVPSIHKKYYLQQGDILVAMTGQGSVGRIGKMHFVGENYLVNQRVGIVRVNKTIANPEFIFQQIANERNEEIYFNLATGAGQPNLSPNDIGNLEVILPPISTQQTIASILSAYDDLIENNLKRIKLLEELAQRTYEEWFVKFRVNGQQLEVNPETGLPEGWERKYMTEVADFLNGFAFKPTDWLEVGIPIIKIKELKNGISNDTPRNDGKRVPKRFLINSGDILFSWSGSLEVVIWQNGDGWLNQHLFKVTPKNGFKRDFVHQALLYSLNEFNSLTTGATMKHIKRKELDHVKVSIPPILQLQEYDSLVRPIQNQILNLSNQNRLLKESRDILLPRLMNGTLSVEKRIEEPFALAAEPAVEYLTN